MRSALLPSSFPPLRTSSSMAVISAKSAKTANDEECPGGKVLGFLAIGSHGDAVLSASSLYALRSSMLSFQGISNLSAESSRVVLAERSCIAASFSVCLHVRGDLVDGSVV